MACTAFGPTEENSAVSLSVDEPVPKQNLSTEKMTCAEFELTEENLTMSFTAGTSVPELISAICAGNSHDKERALVFLVHAAMNDDQRQLMYEAGGIQVLVDMVEYGSTKFAQLCALRCLKWAAHADSKFDVEHFKKLRAGIVDSSSDPATFVELLAPENDDRMRLNGAVYCACAALVGNTEALQESEVVTPLLALLSDEDETVKLWATNALGTLAAAENVKTLIEDSNCVFNVANAEAILQADPLPHLIKILTPDQENLLYNDDAVKLLIQLVCYSATTTASHRFQDTIPLLVSLLRDGTDGQKESAVVALAHLAAKDAPNRKLVAVDADILELLAPLLEHANDYHRESAARVLSSLAVDDACGVADAAVIPLLVSLLRDGTDGQKESAVMALAHLAAKDSAYDAVVDSERVFVELVEPLFREDNMVVMEWAMLVLLKVVCRIRESRCVLDALAREDDETSAMIVETGAFPAIVELLRNGTDLHKQHAAWVLGYLGLISHRAAHEIRSYGAIECLLKLQRNGDRDQHLYAAFALSSLEP
ncbi:unnamed protein product [Phytophthora lilii]|uniref:Unnamed protein product n=1 Tax=Phytophthora lilii TaxID=2077276 RepID=A0A9W6TQW5_9STRA|nr:unnamed protein product [Phytophthora lilii]